MKAKQVDRDYAALAQRTGDLTFQLAHAEATLAQVKAQLAECHAERARLHAKWMADQQPKVAK